MVDASARRSGRAAPRRSALAAVRALELDQVADAAARSLQSGGSGPPENRPSTGPGRSSPSGVVEISTSPSTRCRVLDRGDLRDQAALRDAGERGAPASSSASRQRDDVAPRGRAASTRPGRSARGDLPASRESSRITCRPWAASRSHSSASQAVIELARAVQQQQGGIAGRAERLGVQLPRPVPEAHAPRGSSAACGRAGAWVRRSRRGGGSSLLRGEVGMNMDNTVAARQAISSSRPTHSIDKLHLCTTCARLRSLCAIADPAR